MSEHDPERFFALFDDLEQQAESLYAEERDLELADRTRAEYSAVTLASRLMASLGTVSSAKGSAPWGAGSNESAPNGAW